MINVDKITVGQALNPEERLEQILGYVFKDNIFLISIKFSSSSTDKYFVKCKCLPVDLDLKHSPTSWWKVICEFRLISSELRYMN